MTTVGLWSRPAGDGYADRGRPRLIVDLVAAGARAGELRDDVPADELASFVIGAMSAVGELNSGLRCDGS